MKLPVLVFLLCLVLAVAQLAYHFPELPERVPAHFGAGGQPDRWSSREAFLVSHLALTVLLGGVFAGLAVLIRRLPDRLISLPRRDYWLAPERRERTLAAVGDQLVWFGAGTVVFLGVIDHLSLRVALGRAETLGTAFWVLLVVYLAATLAWSLRLAMGYGLRRD